MKVICEHCKNEIVSCTNCNTGKYEKNYTANAIFLIIVVIVCLISAYRWYSALDDFERAQRLRKAYLKTKLENQTPLPFAK